MPGPEMLKFVQFVAFHVMVEVLPEFTVVGEAERLILQTCAAVTLTYACCVTTWPLELLPVAVYVAYVLSGPVDCEPESAELEMPGPEILKLEQLVAFHVTFDEPPETTLVGLALIEMLQLVATALYTW